MKSLHVYAALKLVTCYCGDLKIAVLFLWLLSVVTLYHLSPFAGRLMEVKIKNHIKNALETAKRWPRPLNRGGR